jgi:nitrile hydratase accessory protein
MAETPPIDRFPKLPRDDEGPVFSEPWQAEAFAMTVTLHAAGHFEWSEWVEYISTEITKGALPDEDEGDHNAIYYRQWLSALERLLEDKGLSSSPELVRRKDAWRRAYEHTPHGEPVELTRAGQS